MNLIVMYARWHRYKQYGLLVLLIALAIAGGIIAFPLSYVTNTNVLVGCCLLPFSLFINGRPRVNYGYLVLILSFAALALLYNVRIFYFFALAFYIVFLLEWRIGRVGYLILFLIAFMSPFFEQIAVILGFPIRLQLSNLASGMLAMLNMNVQASGNMMVLDGTVFTVDEACMGLHLLSISMLMGVFVLAHRYRTEKRFLPMVFLAAFFLQVFILNVVSNLFRIAIIVTFRIMPENPMHDVVGILCLVFYVVVPIYFLSNGMTRRFGRPLSNEGNTPAVARPTGRLIAIALGVTVAWVGSHIHYQRSQENFTYANVTLSNLKPLKIAGGITKFSDADILVYVKPIPEFFSGEHTPLICWKGSGYQYEGIKKVNIGGHQVYMGTLAKSDARLFTAWWYDNGETMTIDQMEWRMRMMKGQPDFCLVNVTAESESMLVSRIRDIFNDDLLSIYAP